MTSWTLRLPGKPPVAADANIAPVPRTPDGRYIVVRGRLWRTANPRLSEAEKAELVRQLMAARRDVGIARRRDDEAAEKEARARVHAAKVALGERGPVWWDDGKPDENRKLARNSSYADWWRAQPGS